MANSFNAPSTPNPPSIIQTGVSLSYPANPGTITDETIYVQGVILAGASAQGQAQTIVAQQNAQASIYGSQCDYIASVYGSTLSAEAQEYDADQRLTAAKAQIDAQYSSTEYAFRQTEVAARVQAAQLGANAQVQSASTAAGAETTVATIRATADEFIATARNATDITVSQTDYSGRIYVADANKTASMYSADDDLQGRKYTADQSLAASRYDADQQLAGTQYTANQQTAQLSTRLSTVKDYLTTFDIAYGVGPALSAATAPTTTDPTLYIDPKAWPLITMGGVFSPAQIQKQVNASLARNDSRTAAQILQAQTELAGRGFSSNSPLLEALKSSYLGQNLRSNADAETQIRLQSAQANAEQILKAQELAVTETQAKQGIILENVKNVNTRLIGTAGVWAQLIGSAL